MRTLLGLTALMVLLALAVWWKTSSSVTPEEMPPTRSDDPGEGILTFGLDEDAPAGTGPADDGTAPGLAGGRATDAGLRPEAGEDGAESPGHDSANRPATGEEPTASQPEAPPAAGDSGEEAPIPVVTYTVRKDETLYSIVSRAYGTAPRSLVEAVAEANELHSPDLLAVGQELALPVITGHPAPEPIP